MNDGEIRRRLVAIVAADVCGYSRLMRADEESVLRALRSHRQELIDPSIERFGGRIANTAGDSILIEFPSAVEALRCAMAVQEGIAARNIDIEPDKQLLFRMGINVGDVIAEGEDLLGDGVNVAARLEGLAEPGGICLSRTARDQIRDLLDVSLHDLGEVEVKNIDRPVRIFKVMADGETAPEQGNPKRPSWQKTAIITAITLVLLVSGATWWWAERPEFEPADPKKFAYELPDKPSLAVLPFDNLSSDPEHAVFAEAISDDLTNNLAHISGLFVIARQATANYKSKPIEVRQVAEDLGVQNVVFGNVRRIDDRVRINVQMVDALSGHQLWTGRFDRQVTDIFALQDEIAGAIATQLSDNLTWSSGPRLTDNVDAHLIWVSAQGDVLPTSPQRLAHAKTLAEKAIELDPNYSRAYALLGLVRTQNGYFGYVEDRKQAIADGLDLAEKAVALADKDWYSHFVHAQALMNTRNYEGAMKAHNRAIALDPSNALLLTFSALPLTFQGLPDKAISRLETAMRLNPYLTWMPPNFMGQALFLKGEYEQAIPYLEKAAELNPKFIGNLFWRAAAYAQTGQTEKAKTVVKNILAAKPGATISGNFIIIKDPVQMERLREGWRKAGLPE